MEGEEAGLESNPQIKVSTYQDTVRGLSKQVVIYTRKHKNTLFNSPHLFSFGQIAAYLIQNAHLIPTCIMSKPKE